MFSLHCWSYNQFRKYILQLSFSNKINMINILFLFCITYNRTTYVPMSLFGAQELHILNFEIKYFENSKFGIM